ncbi:MAG: T9SS type A sorting domain-containing protein, partial [Flavobacteriales bacterium]|nr:T9SS type A sorting domain-containing protein [Flavobacteriales bacterium]
GNSNVNFGGYLSDYNGSDRPEFKVGFYDSSNNLLGFSSTFGNQTANWTFMNETEAVPVGTETIRMILMGTRNAGTDNDCYFDDMFLKLSTGQSGCEEYVSVGIAENNNNRGVRVYPNPFSDEAIIEVLKPSRNSNYELQLFDRTGRLVQSMNSRSGRFSVSSENLAKGFYLYQVSDGKWQSTGKLVVN